MAFDGGIIYTKRNHESQRTNKDSKGEGTRMNINEMPAGEEMDILVAKEVMKWVPSAECLFEGEISIWKDESGNMVASQETWGPANDETCIQWSPSTNIAHAWMVWKKLPRKSNLGFALSIKLIDEEMSSEPDKRVYIVIATYRGATMCGGMADTPELAICRAALKAVTK